MIDEYPELKKGKLMRIYNYILDILNDDKYIFKKNNLDQIKHFFE